MQDFFKKHGVAVMTIRELFDFIVDPCIADDAIDSYLEEVWCYLILSNFLMNLRNVVIMTVRLISGATKDHVKRRNDCRG